MNTNSVDEVVEKVLSLRKNLLNEEYTDFNINLAADICNKTMFYKTELLIWSLFQDGFAQNFDSCMKFHSLVRSKIAEASTFGCETGNGEPEDLVYDKLNYFLDGKFSKYDIIGNVYGAIDNARYFLYLEKAIKNKDLHKKDVEIAIEVIERTPYYDAVAMILSVAKLDENFYSKIEVKTNDKRNKCENYFKLIDNELIKSFPARCNDESYMEKILASKEFAMKLPVVFEIEKQRK